MNKKWMLAAVGIALGMGAVVWAVQSTSVFQTKSVRADYKENLAILTTTELRKLPPLKETDTITPTGKTKEFTLDIAPGKTDLIKGVTVNAITVNGTVPGPTLRVTEGDRVKITVKNNLKEPTSIHWHGLHIPNEQDGVAPITQKPIEPGQTYTYEFLASHAGTFIYHPHNEGNVAEQNDKGFSGLFIIDPQKPEEQPNFDKEFTMLLGGWKVGNAAAGNGAKAADNSMPGMDMSKDSNSKDAAKPAEPSQEQSGMGKMDYNWWTINGKSFPETKPFEVKKGEKVRIRLVNVSNAAHPMHLHGEDFRVIAEDGHPVANPQVMNNLNVAPGKTYDIEFVATNPGTWVFHCHELHHASNDGTEPGGLIQVINIKE